MRAVAIADLNRFIVKLKNTVYKIERIKIFSSLDQGTYCPPESALILIIIK